MQMLCDICLPMLMKTSENFKIASVTVKKLSQCQILD